MLKLLIYPSEHCVTNVGQFLSRLQLQSGETSSNDEDMPYATLPFISSYRSKYNYLVSTLSCILLKQTPTHRLNLFDTFNREKQTIAVHTLSAVSHYTSYMFRSQ